MPDGQVIYKVESAMGMRNVNRGSFDPVIDKPADTASRTPFRRPATLYLKVAGISKLTSAVISHA